MPSITINGRRCEFTPGQMILQVANASGIEIPQYCYHDGLSIVASCRICLGEVWAPNPRNENKLEPMMGGKLLPTCQTPASDGMVVYTDSPKAVQNQRAVMEYLLINHPLDCPVCDQAGECFLQDYSYEYGRGVSRFEESKVKQPKKDLGPHVYLYSDRCILCSRCVRFTREVSGTAELMVQGRGNRSEIDVFPGKALDNELASNVIDLCPVGALLDKDFLFAQRVWFLKSTATIDGTTSSGDNVWAEHNEGRIYRFKPRPNPEVNRWWITDEVRYSWKYVHGPDRLTEPMCRQLGVLEPADHTRACRSAVDGLRASVASGGRLAVIISPMLSCEDAAALVEAARAIHERVLFAVGPVPFQGQDKAFPLGIDPENPKAFVARAEKAPNARGVRRVLRGIGAEAIEFDALLRHLANDPEFSRNHGGTINGVIVTGNYPSRWATPEFMRGLRSKFVVLVDSLASELLDASAVVVPAAVWLEKSGTFENARNVVQAFEQAIPAPGQASAEGQIAMDLLTLAEGRELTLPPGATFRIVDEGPGQVPTAVERRVPHGDTFDPVLVRSELAARQGTLAVFASVQRPAQQRSVEPDAQMVEL